MIQPIRFQCPVCCKECIQQQTFSIGKCQHYFCRDCCISHINAKLNAFEQVKCLTTNCPEKLTKLSKIYSLLPLETQRKFLKHKQFMTLQSNKNLRACKKDQCLGLINIKKVMQNQKQKNFQCDQCGQKHCIKCLELYHGESEPCKIVSQHEKKRQDKFMRALNFRRCPSCSIWVQKNGGCQYLVCKCKTQFCFNCGADFDNDPCRKFLLLQSEMDIRKKSKITYLFRQPQSLMGYLCLLPATLLKIILLILFTILSGVSFMVIVFGFLIPLIYLVAPAGLIVGIGQMQATKKHALLLRILTVLFYPLIGLGTALFVFGIFVSYPILRNIINSHLFDEIDRFMNQVSLVYLKVFNMILSI